MWQHRPGSNSNAINKACRLNTHICTVLLSIWLHRQTRADCYHLPAVCAGCQLAGNEALKQWRVCFGKTKTVKRNSHTLAALTCLFNDKLCRYTKISGLVRLSCLNKLYFWLIFGLYLAICIFLVTWALNTLTILTPVYYRQLALSLASEMFCWGHYLCMCVHLPRRLI